MTNGTKIATAALLSALASPNLAAADSQSFVATQDASLISLVTGPNCGASSGTATTAKIGREVTVIGKGSWETKWRFILQFDLSAIPADSTITSAKLKLHFTSQTASVPIDVTRITNAVWDEDRVLWDTYLCDNDGATTGALAGVWCTLGGDFTMAQSPAPWNPPDMGVQEIDIPQLVQKAIGVGSTTDTGRQLHLLLKTAEAVSGVYTVATSNHTIAAPPTLTVVWTTVDPPLSSPWVAFVDETALRLNAPTIGPEQQDCPGEIPWTNCDAEEKDITVGDFDDDGDDDIIIVRKKPFSVAGARAPVILLNQDGVLVDVSNAKFVDAGGSPVVVPHDARDVFFGDFDRPTPPARSFGDLVLANTCEEDPIFYRNQGGRCSNWGGFTERADWLPPLSTNGRRFCAVWGGDVSGDGKLDVYLSNYNRLCGGGTNNDLSDVLLINRLEAEGSSPIPGFADETASRLGEPLTPASLANVAFGTSVEMHDLDGGGLEIVKICTGTCGSLAPWADRDVFILRNDGVGNFQTLTDPVTHKLNVGRPYMFAGGLLNGDGLIDFFEVDDLDDTVHLATGPFTFATGTVDNSRLLDFGGNVKLGDIDDDGDPDVGVADLDVDADNCGGANGFGLVRNDGSGNFDDPFITDFNFHLSTYDFAFIDINGDGCLDLFSGICSGYKVFINRKTDCG